MRTKTTHKKLLALLLTLVMVLGMLPTVAFAAGNPAPDANSVSINGHAFVRPSSLYYKNGAAETTADSSDYNAYYDKDNGVLELKNYNGGPIIIGGAVDNDITIKLVGTNVITTTYQSGIDHLAQGDINITADSAASLSINVTHDGSTYGIGTQYGSGGAIGSVIISGEADVTLNVTSTSANASTVVCGVYARTDIKVLNSASLDITCSSTAGMLANGLQCQSETGVTINTDGTIDIDMTGCSGVSSVHGIGQSAGHTLTKVGSMTVKYPNKSGCAPINYASCNFSAATHAINTGVLASDSDVAVATYRSGTPYTVTVTGGEVSLGEMAADYTAQFLQGDTVNITALTIEDLIFKKWVCTSGGASFTNETNTATTFTMPASNVEVKADYNCFTTQPTFTRSNDHSGTISFELAKAPDSASKLVEKNSDNVVGSKYFYGTSCSTSIADNNGNDYDVPAGEYRIAVEYSGMTFYSDVFTVNYDDAAPTTYTIAITKGKAYFGAGNEISAAAEGTLVDIKADDPASGQEFDKWTAASGSNVTFADETDDTTTFTMPANAVEITATYKTAEHTHSGTHHAEVPATYDAKGTKEYYECSCGKLFSDSDCTTEVTAESLVIPRLAPVIQEGANGVFTKGSTTGLVFKASPSLTYYWTTSVDGTTIGKGTDYTAASGSTVITLLPEYLETLAVGEHRLSIFFDFGESSAPEVATKFSVQENGTGGGEDETHTYSIDVTSGDATNALGHVITASEPGETITITAYAPSEPGKVFDKWVFTSEVKPTLENEEGTSTTFTMPEADIAVAATYKDAPTTPGGELTEEYEIYVNNGHASIGAGAEIFKAAAGTEITITADPAPAGKVFYKWVFMSEVKPTLENEEGTSTTFTMPEADVAVAATYEDAPTTPGGGDETPVDVKYNVEHYLQQADGTYALEDTDELTGTAGQTVTATPKTYDGYTYDADNENAVPSDTLTATAVITLKLYYNLNEGEPGPGEQDSWTITIPVNKIVDKADYADNPPSITIQFDLKSPYGDAISSDTYSIATLTTNAGVGDNEKDIVITVTDERTWGILTDGFLFFEKPLDSFKWESLGEMYIIYPEDDGVVIFEAEKAPVVEDSNEERWAHGNNTVDAATFINKYLIKTGTVSDDPVTNYYIISATAGEGGSISPSGNVSVAEGNDKTFTMTPNSGYVIDKVLVDGVDVGALASYTFENVNARHTISVSFKAAPTNPDPGDNDDDDDTPSQPGGDTPSQPGDDTPSQPGTDTPTRPGDDTPTQPGEQNPETGAPGQTDRPVDPNVPQTGDNSNFALWIVLACMSLLGMAATLFGKKRSYSRHSR